MTYKMDKKDMKILDILKEHADYTTRQISNKILLPPTTVYNRIKNLKKQGIIKKYSIEVDNKKIGKGFISYVLISVNLPLLKENNKTQYDILNELCKLPWVERADIVSGGTDLIAFVRSKDVEEYDNVLLKKIQLIEGIENTQSLIVLHES